MHYQDNIIIVASIAFQKVSHRRWGMQWSSKDECTEKKVAPERNQLQLEINPPENTSVKKKKKLQYYNKSAKI